MGALEKIEMGASISEDEIEFQEAWSLFCHGFSMVVHEGWWVQIPGGIDLMEDLASSHCAFETSQSLVQLLQLEPVDSANGTDDSFAVFILLVFENWPYVVEQLGEMLLASTYTQQNRHNYEVHQFYIQLAKAFKLQDQDLDVSSMGLMAWSMLSLILPRGMLQRIHLTLPPVLVAEVQSLRQTLFQLDWLEKEIIERIVPQIVSRLKKVLI